MSTNNARPMTSRAVSSIMKKRILITESAIGKKVQLTIQGDGNTIDVMDKEGNLVQSVVDPGTVLQKAIFNVRANSSIAMANPVNRQLLKDAMLAEKAGDTAVASELFTKYLNNTQVSFGVLLPSTIVAKLGGGVDIGARIEKITTENGSLLTIDASSITVLEPEVLGTTTFDLEAMLGDLETAEEKAEREAYEADKKAEKDKLAKQKANKARA